LYIEQKQEKTKQKTKNKVVNNNNKTKYETNQKRDITWFAKKGGVIKSKRCIKREFLLHPEKNTTGPASTRYW
jgi:hypothetical protein